MPALKQSSGFRQRGVVTLAIGMLLLMLVTLVVLYASRSTVLEQRIASNDYQSKLVQAAAAAGLNHAIEHINANARVFNTAESYTYSTGETIGGWLDPNMDDDRADSRWSQSDVIASADCDGEYEDTFAGYRQRISCASGLTGTLYYYDSDASPPADDADTTDDAVLTAIMDAITATDMDMNVGKTGTEFRVGYNVDYVLCPLDVDPSVAAPNSKVQDPPCTTDIEDSRWYAIIVASEGFLEDADGARIENGARAEAHEVVVKFDVLGAGPSVPLMVSGTFGGGGTFDIVANPNGGAAPATGGASGAPFSVWSGESYNLGNNSDTCQLYEFYTTGSEGPHATDPEYTVCYECACPGQDAEMLLSDEGVNGIDILDDDPNFPDDVFQYIFGVPREDRSLIEDIARSNDQHETDCSGIDQNSSGLYWITGECRLSLAGRPSSPVVLVVEGDVRLNADAKVFGVVYAFQSDVLKLNGGAQVYGAVIGDNVADASGQGNHSIVYDQGVLDRVMLSPDLIKISRLPGTWSDRAVTH